MDILVGKVFDDYQILQVLGRGGMGVVYKAREISAGRDVTLKFMDRSLAHNEALVNKFQNEARALARLDNPYIVETFGIRTIAIGMCIVMEYVEGQTLASYLEQQGALPIRQAVAVIEQILNALSHAHEANVIHRDIKPGNIMLTNDHTVKLMDFGIAKFKDASESTQSGLSVGTLEYMSPEHIRGEKNIDQRTDLWSMGVLMYEMVSGKKPFVGPHPAVVSYLIMNEQPTPFTGGDQAGGEAMKDIIHRCLQKDRENRYRSASDLWADIRVLNETLSSVEDGGTY